MPRKLNPGNLTVGHGRKAPAVSPRPSLEGDGLVGAGPNIGAINEGDSPGMPGQYALDSVRTHVKDPRGAHQAAAIGYKGFLWATNAQGSIDELSSGAMRRPPMLGEWHPSTGFSGIPDWGWLKLRDGGLENYTNALEAGAAPLTFTDSTVQNSGNVFPYLLGIVGPARDTEFSIPMSDPATDFQFNSSMDLMGAAAGLLGAGYGRCHIGAFTRDGDAGPAPLPISRSARLYPRPTGVDAETGRPERVPVTVSGVLFPADRGVLALLHFAVPPTSDVKASFLAQPLVTDDTEIGDPQGRVVAALLLGNGILGKKCTGIDPCESPPRCDGGPGGIFGVGVSSSGMYDPFAFPGRSSGQYDLSEIHQGVNTVGDALRTPWDDLDDDGNPGTSRAVDSVIPAPGQVRLGTDLDAGVAPVPYGIPILGGTDDWYDVAPGVQAGSLGEPIHGDALVLSSNFFRYRLPVLKDYSPETGLRWTPRGESTTGSFETHRYFQKAVPHQSAVYPDGATIGAHWRSAGLFEGFDEDFWTWQVARYRQTFLMPSIEVDGLREEAGTYMLIHFKTETDFERCVVLGEFPWDIADPYEVYGVSAVSDPENVGNVANPWLEAVAAVPPNGPATSYGYAAGPYHGLRNRVFLDPAGKDLPAVIVAEFDHTSDSTPAEEHAVRVSGVAYFTPRNLTDGSPSFHISQCDVELDAGFWTSYRTDSKDYVTGVGPAIVGSQNPVALVTAPWGYSGALGLPSSLGVPVDSDPAVGLIPDTTYQRQWVIEMPFTHLGSNGSGPFTDVNAPLDANGLSLSLPSDIELWGDIEAPAFSRNAVMRAHFRRPLNHISPNATSLPFTAADGHGEILQQASGHVLLLHTTRFSMNDPSNGSHGNFVVGALGAPPNTGHVALHRYPKDRSEQFLDEVARYVANAPAALDGHGPYTTATIAHLDGPGMGGWGSGPIETPVRISLADAPWNNASWLLMEHFLYDLTGVNPAQSSLQVAGLPDRNPAISAVATMPFPSSGVLQYPQGDYSTGHEPEEAVHIADPQPDYSAATGTRSYIRCLDAAFAHSLSVAPVSVAGQTELTLRIDGITLEDFAYAAPGPGGLASDRITIMVKVPGLTTWMDVGRLDGAGPSKQDAVVDGAGCMVSGPATYTFTDPVTGYKGCYVRVHVGPIATLFANPASWSAYTAGSPLGEAPVLIKVMMGAGAVSYNLEHVATGVGTFEVDRKPGAAPSDVRGLIGLSVVHPGENLISP